MTARLIASLAAGAALAAAAPAAADPVLGAIKPCYVSAQVTTGTYVPEPVQVTGSGFEPNSAVDVLVDGAADLSAVRIGPDGVLAPQTVYPPVVTSGQDPFMVAVIPILSGYEMPLTLTSRVSALAVDVRPKRARPSLRVRFSGRGFTDRGAIYGHYLFHGALRKTVRLAPAPTTRCGTFVARRAQFPFRPHKGVWTLQVDQHRRLSAAGPLVRLTIDVRRRPRTR